MNPVSSPAPITTSNASQYLGLYRKYLFHRDYIMEHCSPGLAPVWREILTMMKVVVYLYENRGTIQVFLVKDLNAFLLDNETMPLDKDSHPLPASPVRLSPVSTTPEPQMSKIGGIKVSKSFTVVSGSLKERFRTRSVSNPVMVSEDDLLPAAAPQSQQQHQQPQAHRLTPLVPPDAGGDSSFTSHHQRSVSSTSLSSSAGGSLISKIFKSRSFDFKASRDLSPEASKLTEDGMEDEITKCLAEEGPEQVKEPQAVDATGDGLGPLRSLPLKGRHRSASTSLSRTPTPAASSSSPSLVPRPVAAPVSSSSPSLSPSPSLPHSASGDSLSSSPTPSMLRRCSSVKFSRGLSKDDSASIADRADAEELISSIFSSKAKEQERDLAMERLVRTSYRHHIRRRAVCLFHNEDVSAIEDASQPMKFI